MSAIPAGKNSLCVRRRLGARSLIAFSSRFFVVQRSHNFFAPGANSLICSGNMVIKLLISTESVDNSVDNRALPRFDPSGILIFAGCPFSRQKSQAIVSQNRTQILCEILMKFCDSSRKGKRFSAEFCGLCKTFHFQACFERCGLAGDSPQGTGVFHLPYSSAMTPRACAQPRC